MDRLTRQEIENIRRNGVHAIRFNERTDKVIELCDLALQSLSQEAVRDEALEEAAEICQRLSDKLRKSAYNARGNQPKWRSLHRKRNGVIACIAVIRTLKSRA